MIHCFVPFVSEEQAAPTVANLKACTLVSAVTLLATDAEAAPCLGCDMLHIDSLTSSATVRAMAAHVGKNAEFVLFYTKTNTLEPGYYALHRFVEIARDSHAGMLYADHYTVVEGERKNSPVIDYQEGSLRDDFDFGSLLFYNAADFVKAAADVKGDYTAAGLYELRLAISRIAPIVHINEYLYSDVTVDNRASGKKIFDYVDPKNRGVQIEMEKACT